MKTPANVLDWADEFLGWYEDVGPTCHADDAGLAGLYASLAEIRRRTIPADVIAILIELEVGEWSPVEATTPAESIS